MIRWLPLLLAGCAWRLGVPAADYGDEVATLPLVSPSTDRKRWYVPLDAGEAGTWLLFVDTGYSFSTCDDDFVAALGAATGPERRVRGEVGSVSTRKVQLPPLTLGGHTLEGLVCLERDLGATSSIRDPSEIPVAGVLGIDALRPFQVELDPAAGEIRLHPPGSRPPVERGEGVVPIRREQLVGTRVRLPLTVDGVEIRPILDTGASNTYIHGSRLGLEPAWVDSGVVVRGTGPNGQITTDRAYYDVSDVALAGHPVGPLTLTDRPRGPRSGGLLGLDVLDRFTVELDFARGLARIEPVEPIARPSWHTFTREPEPIEARIAPVSPAN